MNETEKNSRDHKCDRKREKKRFEHNKIITHNKL